jgi:hypothetical protein
MYFYISTYSKIKSQKEVKNCRNEGLSYFLCLLMEGSGSVQIMRDLDPGDPKKHTDPDPQH